MILPFFKTKGIISEKVRDREKRAQIWDLWIINVRAPYFAKLVDVVIFLRKKKGSYLRNSKRKSETDHNLGSQEL